MNDRRILLLPLVLILASATPARAAGTSTTAVPLPEGPRVHERPRRDEGAPIQAGARRRKGLLHAQGLLWRHHPRRSVADDPRWPIQTALLTPADHLRRQDPVLRSGDHGQGAG